MAKSNLKTLNSNYITQFSNFTIDSKYSNTNLIHFYLYYKFLLNALSTNVNIQGFNATKIKKLNVHSIAVDPTFFLTDDTQDFIYKTKQLSFELDLNLVMINNKLTVIYNFFNFTSLDRSSVSTDTEEEVVIQTLSGFFTGVSKKKLKFVILLQKQLQHPNILCELMYKFFKTKKSLSYQKIVCRFIIKSLVSYKIMFEDSFYKQYFRKLL